jgi:hypothetical protein
MDIVDYIYDECHRQHVTNYGDFAKAWHDARILISLEIPDLLGLDPVNVFAVFVMNIAENVEPNINSYGLNNSWNGVPIGNLRTSHVGFMHGGSAAPAGEVRERFDRWCGYMMDWVNVEMNPAITPSHEKRDEFGADQLIKQLLDIHPWADGNGRTASILRNWMLGTLNDPTPLPYYYGNV